MLFNYALPELSSGPVFQMIRKPLGSGTSDVQFLSLCLMSVLKKCYMKRKINKYIKREKREIKTHCKIPSSQATPVSNITKL